MGCLIPIQEKEELAAFSQEQQDDISTWELMYVESAAFTTLNSTL